MSENNTELLQGDEEMQTCMLFCCNKICLKTFKNFYIVILRGIKHLFVLLLMEMGEGNTERQF